VHFDGMMLVWGCNFGWVVFVGLFCGFGCLQAPRFWLWMVPNDFNKYDEAYPLFCIQSLIGSKYVRDAWFVTKGGNIGEDASQSVFTSTAQYLIEDF
jgi:hypothetical protein